MRGKSQRKIGGNERERMGGRGGEAGRVGGVGGVGVEGVVEGDGKNKRENDEEVTQNSRYY